LKRVLGILGSPTRTISLQCWTQSSLPTAWWLRRPSTCSGRIPPFSGSLTGGFSSSGGSLALSGKPAVGVALAGLKDGEGASLLGVENFIRGMGMEVKGRSVIHAALPGEALLSEEGKAAAGRLASALFAKGARPAENPSCTQCGGTYFEFRGGNRVYCLLCGASGMVSSERDGVRIATTAPAHSWRGPESRKMHSEWLIGMKEKYRRDRDRLKSIAQSYAGGTFI